MIFQVTAYGIRPGSVVALVGGDPLPPRSSHTAPPATTTATAPPPVPASAPVQRPVTPNPPPSAPTQSQATSNTYSVPVNGPEAASIMKIQSEWDSCEYYHCVIRTMQPTHSRYHDIKFALNFFQKCNLSFKFWQDLLKTVHRQRSSNKTIRSLVRNAFFQVAFDLIMSFSTR
jgi:hypothetical protein